MLAGAAWLGGAGAGGAEVIEQLRKPTALICSSRGAERAALPGGRLKRDELLLDLIRAAIVKGGIVLVPTDSSARVLELAYLLEHAWRDASKSGDPLSAAKLYLASKNIGATMRYTRSMLEWMDDGIIREFEAVAGAQGGRRKGQGNDESGPGKDAGPFDFKHLRLLERKAQCDRILNVDNAGDGVQPGMVIVASDSSLEWGFSKDVLRSIASDPRNLVILTERSPQSESGSSHVGLSARLWANYEARQDGVALEQGSKGEKLEQVYGGGRDIEVRNTERVALEGNDLAVYQQWLATQRQLQTTLQPGGATAMESSADVIDDASSESSSESEGSETEQQGKALNISSTLGQANRKKIGMSDEDLGINVLIRRKGVYDYDVRGKKGREKMFPMVIRRKRADEFGDLIRPEEYLRAEERDEVDGQDMRGPGKFDSPDTLGKKRKWDDIATSNDRRMSNGANKRPTAGNGHGRDDLDLPFPNDFDGALDMVDVDEGMEEDSVIAGPSKVVFSTEVVTLNLRLAFVDFEGLHDKRSLQMLIPLIQPRKLILVSGMEEETLALASDCRRILSAQAGGGEGDNPVDVYTPVVGDTVDASVDTNAWVVKLTDSLVKQLHWQNVKGLGIVTLTGRLAATAILDEQSDGEQNHKKPKLVKVDENHEVESVVSDEAQTGLIIPLKTMPTLDMIPINMVSATRSAAQPLHVGDLRLADLRKIMQASGHTAEFRGEGTLLVDGSVAVRKTGTGRIEVESSGLGAGAGASLRQGGSFFAVKRKIYEGLAVVAGG